MSTEKTYFVFTDMEGASFAVEALDFYEQLKAQSFKLFGMSFSALLEMRKQYIIRCGPLPPTVESIQKIFQEQTHAD